MMTKRAGPPAQEQLKGHRERLRRRFLEAGPRAFADHELLELALSFAIPRRDVKLLAKHLLDECGDLAGVLGAPEDVLLQAPGMGPTAIALIRLAATLSAEALRPERRRLRRKIGSLSDAVTYLRSVTMGKREEELHVILLDAKNGVLGHEVVSRGGTDHVAVFPRQVLELALAKRASGILLAHNHPSDDPSPSAEDRELTISVSRAAAAIGLRLVDHIVLAGASDYSFRSAEPKQLDQE